MDPEYSLQDVLRCHLCESPGPSLHCDICNKPLCEDCEKKHLTDGSTEHKVVPFRLRGCITKCQKHSSKMCDHYCKQCRIPVCEQCAYSLEHRGHKFIDIVKKLEKQKDILRTDLEELEKYIRPKYHEIASIIHDQKAVLNKNSKELTNAIEKHKADILIKIDHAIEKFKSDIEDINSRNLTALNRHDDEIKHNLSDITQYIEELNKLLISNDVSMVSAFKSRNAEFRTLHRNPEVVLPSFTPQNIIDEEHINQLIGSLSFSFFKTEEDSNTMGFPGADHEISPSDRLDIVEPRISTNININNDNEGLCTVSCLTKEQVWTCSLTEKIIRLYNLKGNLVKAIQPKSGDGPWNIAVSKSGDLVYTDYTERTVNIVTDTEIETVISLRGWRPHGVCTTFSGDLLVAITSDDNEQTKVVRYSNFTEKQSIQFDDKGDPLFTSGMYSIKFISENRKLDICVSDNAARAVLVVNQAGKLRFTYSGYQTTRKTFEPVDVTTDSQSRILIADSKNHCIHILNEDGQFLSYIENCHLKCPCGLSVDTDDNVFVTEIYSGSLKKIKL